MTERRSSARTTNKMVQQESTSSCRRATGTFGHGNTESSGCRRHRNTDIDVKDPRLRVLLDPKTSSSESESDSSSEEEKKSSKSKKRKAKQLKKSIPKPVRRRLDKYLKMKLAESKSKKPVQLDTPAYEDTFPDSPPLPPYNPVLQRTHRTHMPFNFL